MQFWIRRKTENPSQDCSEDCFGIIHEFDAETIPEAMSLFEEWVLGSPEIDSEEEVELLFTTSIISMQDGKMKTVKGFIPPIPVYDASNFG